MTDNETPVRQPRKWVPVALFVSLAVNLFFAGLLIGGPAFKDHPREAAPTANIVPSPRMFIRILGREDGRRVLQELRRNVPDLRQKFITIRTNHLRVVAAMKADPYDPAELAAAFTAVREAHADLTSSIQEPLTGILAKLTPEQRLKFAKAFERLRGPRHRRGGDHQNSEPRTRPGHP